MTQSNQEQTKVDSNNNYQISLLEEKLKVARRKQKVGEVIIYKDIETKLVTIPIRREKLIVKRVGKNPQELTQTTLTEESLNGFKYDELENGDRLESNYSEFMALKKARKLLRAIEELELTEDIKIKLEIASTSLENKNKIQTVCDSLLDRN